MLISDIFYHIRQRLSSIAPKGVKTTDIILNKKAKITPATGIAQNRFLPKNRQKHPQRTSPCTSVLGTLHLRVFFYFEGGGLRIRLNCIYTRCAKTKFQTGRNTLSAKCASILRCTYNYAILFKRNQDVAVLFYTESFPEFFRYYYPAKIIYLFCHGAHNSSLCVVLYKKSIF